MVWWIFGILLTPLAEWVVPEEFFETFRFCETFKIEPMTSQTTMPRRNPVLSTMDCLINTLFPERSWVGGGGASLLSNRLLIRLLLSNVVLTAYRNSCRSLLGFGSSRLNAIAAIASVILALLVDW